MTAVPHPRRHMRATVGIAAVATLVGAGLVSLPATPAAAQVEPLPPEADVYLVSRTDQGVSGSPYLTPDGQKAVYASTAGDLVEGTQTETSNIFLATAIQGSSDPFSGAPALVSRPDASLPDEAADDMSYDPVASADGRYIAFVSHATNLVAGPSAPGRANVYVHDMLSGATFRLDAGALPDGDSYEPDMSDDGRYVVFTSDATNLSADDTNGAADVFVADLDEDADGTRGDVALTRLLSTVNVAGGLSEPAISGNGEWVLYTARTDNPNDESATPGTVPYLFRSHRTGSQTIRILEGAHDGAIDSTGNAFAAIVDNCEGQPVIAGATLDALQGVYAAGVGWSLVDRRVGELWAPVISADGSTIAWSTTQPEFDFSTGGAVPDPLPEPVVRVAQPSWWDASSLEVQCAGILGGDTVELGVGDAASISASGRTIAFGGPTDMSAAERSVTAVDLHTHDGLAVSNTMGELSVPGYVTSVDVSEIPVSAVTDYGAALANAPIYRLPIYRLPIYRLPIYRLPIYRLLIGDSPIYRLGVDDAPIYRLPIYRLPIYRLPIYRLDIPGGWSELLAATPFTAELQQSVALADVLDWATTALADPLSTQEERDAAALIQSLSLDDVGLDGTGIDSLSIASLVLGGAKLSQVEIAGTGESTARWQALADAQGLGVQVDDAMVLAELDAAGLDVAQTGIDAVPVNALPIESTLLDELPMAPAGDRPGLFLEGTPLGALDVATLTAAAQTALFGGPRSGTLADNADELLATATVADLASGAPDAVTVGMLLFSILDSASYPWEQIDPSVIPAGVTVGESDDWSCQGNDRCGRYAQFQFTFDPGPGEPTAFPAPTASVELPAATKPEGVTSGGSGPGFAAASDLPYDGPAQVDGSLVRFPLADGVGGTVRSMTVEYTASRQPGAWSSKATLSSGSLSAQDEIFMSAPQVYYDVADHNRNPDGQWSGTPETLTEGVVHYEWISPAWMDLDDFGRPIQGPAEDEDWYYVKPPKPGERLVVSSNAADGQIALSLLKPEEADTPLGVASLGDAPGTAVTEQDARDAGSPAESGADAGAAVPGQVIVDQAVVGGDGTTMVQASASSAGSDENWLVRVTSGNGLASSQLYSLRASYVQEQPEQRCAPWQAPLDVVLPDPANPPPEVASDEVGSDTNTLFVTDVSRLRATHGVEATDEVIAAIRALDGTGSVGDGTVQGAILAIDTDPAVIAARAALDQQPCSMTARRTLAAAVNAFVDASVGAQADGIASLVIVGGDDIVPFAPVAQHTAQFNEASHAAELKLDQQPDGSACPAELAAGAVDPCATPLSAAAAGDYILSDDPYGLADAYQSLGGYLYVPTVAVGRLVDTPDQIRGQLDRFRYADGMLEGDSALTGGYGAWAELPQLVSEKLAWRLGGGDEALAEPWTREDAEARLFPADGSDAPRIVSLNTHADERRLLAGVEGAEGGAVDPADIIEADAHAPGPVPPADQVYDPSAPTSPLDGSVLFMIGCHAGNNLPSAYYGDVTDWADVFSPAGGFVGNTGFGLANNVTTALSERLLGLYADWIGVSTEDGAVSSGAALAYAKQSYLGRLGLYTGYDEKVLMQSVYYGLPMYAFEDSTKALPLPDAPDLQIVDGEDGLSSASLSLTPSFATVTREDQTGQQVSYVTVGDEQPLATAGQPVLPKVVTQVPSDDGSGKVPRGALITSLTSEWSGVVRPAIGDPGIGVEQSGVTKDGLAFPSSFASVSWQQTPDGPVSLIVATPANVQSAHAGLGRIETFPEMGMEVLYGPGDGDSVAPVIRSTEQRGSGFSVSAYDAGGEVVRAVLLVQDAAAPDEGAQRPWHAVELEADAQGAWRGTVPEAITGAYRWILQVVDASGNVTTDSARGRIQVADAPAPELGEAGEPLTVTAGERVVRSIPVTNVEPGAFVTGTYTLFDGDAERAKGALTMTTAADGSVSAVLDIVAATPGSFQVSLQACAVGLDCGEPVEFALTVRAPNTAPRATVRLDDDDVTPASELIADAAGEDADEGDAVTLSYRWLRNGVPIEGADAASLDLEGIAQTGDVIRVEVVPNDGETDGHAAAAEVVVGEDLPLPTIAVWATSAGETYDEGTWARADVVVSFTCTGVGVECPAPVTVATDTAGRLVEQTITDELGRQATAGITVRRDTSVPALAPTVSPNPVAVGGTATAVPSASDTGSGIATQSCDAPDTATAGTKTLTCRATDVAGNSATATATYSVVAASPACRLGSRVVMQPVNPDGSSVFARISAVPVVFRLCDAFGRLVTAKGSVTSVTQVSAAALPKKGPSVNELPVLLPTVKPVYVPLTGLWAGSIGSSTLKSGQKYVYRVNLADGTSFDFSFGIK